MQTKYQVLYEVLVKYKQANAFGPYLPMLPLNRLKTQVLDNSVKEKSMNTVQSVKKQIIQ